jgi:hypothetical protein
VDGARAGGCGGGARGEGVGGGRGDGRRRRRVDAMQSNGVHGIKPPCPTSRESSPACCVGVPPPWRLRPLLRLPPFLLRHQRTPRPTGECFPHPEPYTSGAETPLPPSGASPTNRGRGRRNPNHHQRAPVPLPPSSSSWPQARRRLSPFTPLVFREGAGGRRLGWVVANLGVGACPRGAARGGGAARPRRGWGWAL